MKVINERLATLARRAAPLWWLLALFLGRRSRSKERAPVRTVLVFDFHLIGDIVLLTPLLAALREGYQGARIVLVAGPWAKEILRGTELVDEIIPFSAPWVKYGQGWRGVMGCLTLVRRLRQEYWDLGIEVRGDVRQIFLLALSGATRRVGYDFTGGAPLLTDVVPDDGSYAHLAEHNRRIAEFLGIWPEGRCYLPFLKLTKEESERARNIVPYIGFHFGASLPLRRLPQEETARLLADWASMDCPLVLFVPPDDVEGTRVLLASLPGDLAAKVDTWSGSLRDFIVMVSRAEQVFLMDSGPAHVATALGVQVTVFFGPNFSAHVRPMGDNVEVIEKASVSCRPCDQVHCHYPEKHFCMRGLVASGIAPLKEQGKIHQAL